jgi:cysteine desulfurase
MIYFDHNATTPVLPEANQAWLSAIEEFFGNPSSLHRAGARADHALERARCSVAQILNCDPTELIWTSGATESNNLAIYQLARSLPSGSRILVSSIEHPSVLEPARFYFGNRISWIPCRPDGVIDFDRLKESVLRENFGAVILMAANNETGILQPWRETAELCEDRGVRYFCDAVQWTGKMSSRDLGRCSFVSGSGHKFGAPRGIGFLKAGGGPFHPLFHGGVQEGGRRGGTENVAGAVAAAKALECCEYRLTEGFQMERVRWRSEMVLRLSQEIPGIQFLNPHNDQCLWNTISCIMPDVGCSFRWVVKLDKAGFAVSSGSACSSGSEKPSHVLKAMGLSDGETSRVLRFSSQWRTTPDDWNSLLKALKKLLYEAQKPSLA